MKKFLVFFLLFSVTAFAQNVNDYKFVVLPFKYDFLNEADKYNLNSNTKALFEKYGFVVYFNNDQNIPEEIADYNCAKLYANVESVGNLLLTRLLITLKDCKGNILFSSKGKSREKDFKLSYNLALRAAALEFENLNYQYNGTSFTSAKALKDATEKIVDLGNIDNQNVDRLPVSDEVNSRLLFAQPLQNGFQLVDNSPKVIFKIFNTSVKDVYIAEKGNQKGTLLQKDNQWIFEYYDGSDLKSEIVQIKF